MLRAQTLNGLMLLVLSCLMVRPGSTQTLTELQESLNIAVCLNNWDRAIALTGPLIGATQVNADYRQTLVAYRETLRHLRDTGAVRPNLPGCEARLSRYLAEPPEIPSPPLNWDNALYSAYGIGNPDFQADWATRQQDAQNVAGLANLMETSIEALSPVTPIDTASGSGVSAGVVGRDQQIYSFVGGMGDLISIRLDVTEIYSGNLYTDDDSQLFLFDDTGTLLADNDDFSSLQSSIFEFLLPQTSRYYLAVTTYNNDPILNSERQVTAWSGAGSSEIAFTLSITGLTPTAELVLPTAED